MLPDTRKRSLFYFFSNRTIFSFLTSWKLILLCSNLGFLTTCNIAARLYMYEEYKDGSIYIHYHFVTLLKWIIDHSIMEYKFLGKIYVVCFTFSRIFAKWVRDLLSEKLIMSNDKLLWKSYIFRPKLFLRTFTFSDFFHLYLIWKF